MRAPSPLTAYGRRVRRLRLRAGDHAQAQRLAIALGDALHTASLPEGDGGRMLAIRRLPLGRVNAATSPSSLALLLERAIREATSRAVAFDAPGADAAATVVFPSRSAACVTLARRLARREDTSAWFWEQVVPRWNGAPSRAAQWRLLLDAAHEGDGGALVAARVVAAAVRAAADAGAGILGAITARDAAFWLFAVGLNPAADAPGECRLPPGSDHVLGALLAAARTPTNGGAGERGRTDLRLAWLGTMLLLDARPALAARASLPGAVAQWIARSSEATTLRGDAREPRETLVGDRSDTSGAQTIEHVTAESVHEDVDTRPRAVEEPGEWSTHPGVLLLIPVLQRLGLPRYLERHPEWLEAAAPAELLLFIAARAGLNDEDPLAHALRAHVVRPASAGSAAAEAAPTQGTGRRCATPLPSMDATPWIFHAWLAAVRRWCRRHAGLSWRDIVERPGRVRVSPAHLEVFFAPEQTDIRLRRLALDADPGWVPWLGCVVVFHYEARER